MTIIIKQFLITIALCAAHLTYPLYMVGFDYKTYDEYVDRAHAALINSIDQIKNTTLTNKEFADALRTEQGTVLQDLLQECNAKNDHTLSTRFKNEIYGQWKRRFDRKYKKSLQDNNWSRFNKPVKLFIEE